MLHLSWDLLVLGPERPALQVCVPEQLGRLAREGKIFAENAVVAVQEVASLPLLGSLGWSGTSERSVAVAVPGFVAVLFPAHYTTRAIHVPQHHYALPRSQLDAIVLAALIHKVREAAAAVSVCALLAWG